MALLLDAEPEYRRSIDAPSWIGIELTKTKTKTKYRMHKLN